MVVVLVLSRARNHEGHDQFVVHSWERQQQRTANIGCGLVVHS